MVAYLNSNGTIGGNGATAITTASCSDFSLCYDETSEKVIIFGDKLLMVNAMQEHVQQLRVQIQLKL